MALYFWCDKFENDKFESDKFILCVLGIQVRNMKMGFKFYGT